MSADERLWRLENAVATLAEVSANRGRRTARLEEAVVRLEERTGRLGDEFARSAEGLRAPAQSGINQQRRITQVEES